ncbi:MAG: biotin/lipoyl-binding protein [Limisphaerales bacterium]
MAAKQSSGWLKWTIILVVVGALVLGAILYFKHGQNETLQYQTTVVERGDLTQAVTATGTLNPVVNVTVGSQVSGRISRLYADFNSTVSSNQVIAEIDPSSYQATVEQVTADLSNAQGEPRIAASAIQTQQGIVREKT